MGLLSFLKRKSENDPRASSSARDTLRDPALSVQAARTGARHRLLGAVILLAVGVIGFPLVFETQPRPIAIDIPIEIPRKDAQPPLQMPPAKSAPIEVASSAPAVESPEPAPPEGSADTKVAMNGEKPVASATQATAPAPIPAAVTRSAADKAQPERPAALASAPGKTVATKSTASASASTTSSATQSEAARAKALLGSSAASEPVPTQGGGRFVVQVGAFADASAAREVRLKVEKLGFKTYTQVAETASGKRIRVRVGPLASREEADAAFSRIKASGLAAVVLTL